MLKGLLIFIVFGVTVNVTNAQTESFIGVGLNRIGVLYNLGISQNLNKHKVGVGLRFYEPDIVFEKDFPAILVNYNYGLLKGENYYLRLGTAMDISFDNKVDAKLWVFNPQATFIGGRKLNNGFNLELLLGVGAAINKIDQNAIYSQHIFTYLNYEVCLGLTYLFGDNSKH